MSVNLISVDDGARNLGECVHRVHGQGEEFLLLQDGIPRARIVPVAECSNRGADLLTALNSSQLSDEEAAGWLSDLDANRTMLGMPPNRWE